MMKGNRVGEEGLQWNSTFSQTADCKWAYQVERNESKRNEVTKNVGGT